MSRESNKRKGSRIVALTDDSGNELALEYIDRIKYKGNNYAVMIPMESDDEESDKTDSVVILKILSNNGDNTETYSAVDNEKTLNAIFERFKEKNKDRYDFE